MRAGSITDPRIGRRLSRAFFARHAPHVARALIGKILVHEARAGLTAGVVVETEAYDQDDPASHTFRGRTARNAVMFGPPGVAYVYFSYGNHWCLNAVTGREGHGEAVLIRALEPLVGIERMRRRRGPRISDRDLARGPGRLTEALAIDRRHDGASLLRGELGFFAPARRAKRRIASGPRIGITKGVHAPWRFFDADSPFVSRNSGRTR
ncbi:MAG TPA: DNA-3-methyladenine glycosylase [bacterium]|nr:DNA-3-methyladenine glycosylase [bacterium]